MSAEQPQSIGLKTAIGAGWMLLWRMISRALGVVSILVLARLLTPGDFGLVAIATMLVGVLDALAYVAWYDAVIRADTLNRARLDTGFTINVARGLAAGAILGLSAPLVAGYFSDPRLEPILYVLAVLAVLEGAENVGMVEYQRNLQFGPDFVLFLVPRLAGFFVTIAAAVMLRSYWALMAGIVAQRVVRFATSYAIHPYRPWFSLAAMRELLGFSLWLWVTNLAMQIRDRFPPLALGRYLDAASVGRFTMGWEISMLPITEMVHPIARALFPGFSSAVRKGSEMAEIFPRVIGVIALLVLPAGVGISAVAADMVRIALGPAWSATTPIVEWIAVAAPFSVFASVCGACLVAIGRVKGNMAVNVVAAVLLVAVGIPLVAGDGLRGIVAACVIVIVAEGLLAVLLTSIWLRGRLAALVWNLWRTVLAGAAMALALRAAGLGWVHSSASFEESALRAAAAVALGIVTYAAALLAAWRMVGGPDGPERWVLQFAGKALGGRLGFVRSA
jgi:O-antigen/teichoic acid export membrane protein